MKGTYFIEKGKKTGTGVLFSACSCLINLILFILVFLKLLLIFQILLDTSRSGIRLEMIPVGYDKGRGLSDLVVLG